MFYKTYDSENTAISDVFNGFIVLEKRSMCTMNELHCRTNITKTKISKSSKGLLSGNVNELSHQNNTIYKSRKIPCRNLKMGCLNIRSLCSKIDELQLFVLSHDFDVFSVNETWLNESVNDSEIAITGYNLIRKDRNRNGGGVCFYVKQSIDFKERNDIGNGIESLWFSVKHKNKLVMFGTIYRPPNSTTDYYDNMFNEIQRAKGICDHLIIMGDFNYDYVNDKTLSKNPIFNIEMLFDMKQLIQEPTRKTVNTKSLLDVIITSDYELHENTTVIHTSMSDHDCVYSEYKLINNLKKQKHKQINYRDFKKFNVDSFLKELMDDPAITDTDFENEKLCEKWELFKLAFVKISDKHAPVKTMRVKERHYPWVNSNIVKLMYERNHAKKCAVKNKCISWWQKYKCLRNRVNVEIRNARKDYYKQKLAECGNNPKKMWKCINKITGSKTYKSPHKDLSATIFNDHFSTIGEKIISQMSNKPESLPWKQPACETVFAFNFMLNDDVYKSFKKLGNDSNTDVLGFDSKLLSLSSEIIAPMLTKLFNASLISCIVPNDWKTACVTPIFKGKGDVSDKSNYRPISLIAHISKIFEMSVHKQLLKYFQDNNLISIDQSAYLKLHNTQTSLHRVIDDWIDNLCFNSLTGICTFDIKKCFDSIDHDLLLKKMEFYGVRNNEVKWFKDYLSDRSQVVKCHGVVSDKRIVNVGVPQGSVLGPILFVIFINDISQHVNIGTANLFADDTLIYCTGNNMSETNATLQTCVNDISNWYRKNNIVINEDKCFTMVVGPKRIKEEGRLDISINGHGIEHVKVMNYLGLEIDDALTWDNYINKLCKSLYVKISKFVRLSKTLSKEILIKIYNSTIQPTIDYVISVWGCTSSANINKIQRLQNYCARVIEKNFNYVQYRGLHLVKKLGWMNVKERYLYFQTLLIFKCIHGLAPHYLTNNIILDIEVKERITRQHDMNLYLPIPESENHKKMFIYRGAKSWNNLPGHMKDCNDLDKFKRLLKYHVKNVAHL